MDPKIWGPYGWKMIHSYSRLSVSMEDYTRWLITTSKILPCRKCRRNFKRHIQSQICKEARSNEYLSICLHKAVSDSLDKSQREYTIHDLPGVTRENLFQPEFWSTLYINTTLGKDRVIREWLRETERILRKGKREEEADLVHSLLETPLFVKKADYARKRDLRNRIREFQMRARIRVSYEFGKSSTSRATRKRARIPSRKDPSGSESRASRKRKYT